MRKLGHSQGNEQTFPRVSCSGLILPDAHSNRKRKILQNLIHIIMPKVRYIEPILAGVERSCQGRDSYNSSLYAVKHNRFYFRISFGLSV